MHPVPSLRRKKPREDFRRAFSFDYLKSARANVRCSLSHTFTAPLTAAVLPKKWLCFILRGAPSIHPPSLPPFLPPSLYLSLSPPPPPPQLWSVLSPSQKILKAMTYTLQKKEAGGRVCMGQSLGSYFLETRVIQLLSSSGGWRGHPHRPPQSLKPTKSPRATMAAVGLLAWLPLVLPQPLLGGFISQCLPGACWPTCFRPSHSGRGCSWTALFSHSFIHSFIHSSRQHLLIEHLHIQAAGITVKGRV